MLNMFSWNKDVETAPIKDWMQEINEKTKYTPDIAALERRFSQLLFVYDEMNRGHRSHLLIEEHSVPVCTAFTMNNYVLWKRVLGHNSFPIPLTQPYHGIPTGKIRGELYAVQPSRYLTLDKYKQNGVQFERKRVKLLIPYTEKVTTKKNILVSETSKVHIVKAWMYEGIGGYWDNLIDSGYMFKPVGKYLLKKPVFGEYYYFNDQEYKDT